MAKKKDAEKKAAKANLEREKKGGRNKRSKASPATRSVGPYENPDGLFSRLSALRNDIDAMIQSMSSSLGFPDIRLPRIELPPASGIADIRFEVADSPKSFEVVAELPGLTADNVRVGLSEGMLTVEGEKADSREHKDHDYVVSERRHGQFSRSFRVPENIDEAKLSATFENGVLTIRAPKKRGAEEKISRAIPIKSA